MMLPWLKTGSSCKRGKPSHFAFHVGTWGPASTMMLPWCSGICLLLFTVNYTQASDASDTYDNVSPQITSPGVPTHGSVSFVQRKARALYNTESKGVGGSDSASPLMNKTLPNLLTEHNVVNNFQDLSTFDYSLFHVSLINVLGAPNVHLMSAEEASLADEDGGEDSSHVDNIAAWWLIPAAICACTVIGAYVCRASTEKASEASSSPDCHQSNDAQGNASRGQAGVSNEQRTPRDVVEDLGMGLAQLRILFLADGICFIDGWELGLVGTVATATATDMGMGDYGRALLSSAIAVGLMPGSMLGGWLGDRFGRRPPILASYAFMAICAWGTSVAPDAKSLLACRVAMGFACGVGLPCTTVMISELAPRQWRIAMICLRSFLWTSGVFCAHLICWILDPTLENLDWRLCFRLTIPPLLVFLILTSLLLDESPMFLACIGDHAKAQAGFESMRQLNSCPDVSISYADAMPWEAAASERVWTGSLWDHLCVMFTRGMLGCSITLFILSISTGLYGAGHGYGLPRVLIVETEKHKLEPGMQLMIDCAWGYVACLMLFALGTSMTRKGMLLAFQTILAVVFSTFAWSAHSDQQIWLVVLMLQVSLAITRMVLKMDFMILGLVGTECYPTAMLATGTAVIAAFGRFGSVAGPIVFEWLHSQVGVVTAFYYACSILAFSNSLAIAWLLPQDLETARTFSTEYLNKLLLDSASRQA
mmetsp:Transcript_50526/g.88878  ORF Transcript_50526/g.88878 Transcript_50526/m.88878 type:complete len:708 (-) Transcript_50526:33-2156(-)